MQKYILNCNQRKKKVCFEFEHMRHYKNLVFTIHFSFFAVQVDHERQKFCQGTVDGNDILAVIFNIHKNEYYIALLNAYNFVL